MSHIEKIAEPFNEALRPWKKKIDELAFYNETRDDLGEKIGEGLERVFHYDGSYNALYRWFKSDHPGIRFELLNIRDGRATNAHRLIMKGLLHGSFKCANHTEYYAMLCALENQGFDCVQHFIAQYGAFSYWAIPGTMAFLKPRVNLRDAVG